MGALVGGLFHISQKTIADPEALIAGVGKRGIATLLGASKSSLRMAVTHKQRDPR